MNLSIIGTGYVGLVSGACLADIGNTVTCIDINKSRIAALNKNKMPFHEPYLSEIVQKNAKQKRLIFSNTYNSVNESEFIFLCIDTPSNSDGQADLKNFWSAIKELSKFNLNGKIIMLKSTVPPGTNKAVANFFLENSNILDTNFQIDICSNPEFLREGSAVNDFLRPNRIIIGANNNDVLNRISQLYAPLNRRENKIILMKPESAELVKYSSNAFLATKISFINQISQLCESFDADINEIRNGMGSDVRIGKDFLYAGLGYGGSCFPKDLTALISEFRNAGIKETLLNSTISINERQLNFFQQKIENFFLQKNVDIKKINILFWGLSFKPNTSDLRNSPALKLVNRLGEKVKNVFVYDPVVSIENINEVFDFPNISFSKDKYAKIAQSDCLVIATEWKEFWDPDIRELKKLSLKAVFDGRNILDKKKIIDSGVTYFGIGR